MKEFANKFFGTIIVILVSMGVMSVTSADVYDNPGILLGRYEHLMFWRETDNPE